MLFFARKQYADYLPDVLQKRIYLSKVIVDAKQTQIKMKRHTDMARRSQIIRMQWNYVDLT